ncbi:MAG TPA: hypothetical protein VK662_03545 [Acidothermaceae bacterium]|jgi:hypothetical protein|nr:hypothetical protein [Acidothermaceae bacterium]
MVHPLPWRSSIGPASVLALDFVLRGARSAGSTADALVVPDVDEQARRRAVGLGAVTSLPLLDALLSLPALEPIRVDDLSCHVHRQVRQAPMGVVDLDRVWVTRLLTPPLTVVAAVVRATAWRRAMQRAARFTPFAQRLMVLNYVPPPEFTWEASLAGIGVWAFLDGETQEVCRPEPFVRRYWKAAGWRFAEHAYAAALTSTHPIDEFPEGEDRPAHTAGEVSYQR